MKKQLFITEISEEDFRKLDLKGWANDPYVPSQSFEVSLNCVLDEHTKLIRDSGVLDALSVPVTIAVFNEWPIDGRSFQIGLNIVHLYSTRDYYQSKLGSWKVKKRHLKAIYRVHLDNITH